MNNKSPFTLPDNYFDQFSKKLDQAIISEQSKKSVQSITNADVPRKKTGLWIFSAAAAVAVLVGIVFGGFELANMQEELYRQTESIVAQDSYDEFVLDELDFYQIEDILADADF
ncbi:MAG: hypothetical protein R3Y59_00525 [bacterium]